MPEGGWGKTPAPEPELDPVSLPVPEPELDGVEWGGGDGVEDDPADPGFVGTDPADADGDDPGGELEPGDALGWLSVAQQDAWPDVGSDRQERCGKHDLRSWMGNAWPRGRATRRLR